MSKVKNRIKITCQLSLFLHLVSLYLSSLSSLLKDRFDLFHFVTFNYVLDLYIIVVFDANAAFVAALYFFDVIFKATQGGYLSAIDYNSVADEPDIFPSVT